MNAKKKIHWPALTERYVAVLKIVDYWKFATEEIIGDFRDKMTLIRAVLDEPKHDGVRSVIMSDTIIIVSRDSSDASVTDLIGTLMRVQISLFEAGIAIKGGMSQGIMLADIKRMTFLGQPLLEAEKISKSISLYAIGERCQGQTLQDMDSMRQIDEGYIPLFYPKFTPTSKGAVLMQLVNISIFFKTLDNLREVLGGIEGNLLYSDTLSVFEDAFKFTFPNGRRV